MRIYIAGKITGEPNYKELFEAAEKKLVANGHTVINPARMDYGTEFTRDEYLYIDFAKIDICDGVYFLRNWEESDGAKKEMDYARKRDKKIMFEILQSAPISKREKFQAIADDVVEILARKNHDYGNSFDEARGEFGPTSTVIRLADKFGRLKKLTKEDAQVKDESIEDTYKDIVGYCILELAYRELEEK